MFVKYNTVLIVNFPEYYLLYERQANFPLFISKLEKLVEYLFLMLWANRTTINLEKLIFWSVSEVSKEGRLLLSGFGLLLLCEVQLRHMVGLLWLFGSYVVSNSLQARGL